MTALEEGALRLIRTHNDGLALASVGVNELRVDGINVAIAAAASTAAAAKGILLQHQLNDLWQYRVQLIVVVGAT